MAHPPVKVSRKAYEFSKQIAGVLQFKLHPRCDLWPENFQANFPDGNDIALYFYPGKFERFFFCFSLLLFLKLNLNLCNSLSFYFRGFFGCRSRKKYSSLLKFIEQNDLALKSLMGHVELLVFPSSLLHKNSQSELASPIFLSCFSNFANKQNIGFLAFSL